MYKEYKYSFYGQLICGLESMYSPLKSLIGLSLYHFLFRSLLTRRERLILTVMETIKYISIILCLLLLIP